jgi:small GTP-binding protein
MKLQWADAAVRRMRQSLLSRVWSGWLDAVWDSQMDSLQGLVNSGAEARVKAESETIIMRMALSKMKDGSGGIAIAHLQALEHSDDEDSNQSGIASDVETAVLADYIAAIDHGILNRAFVAWSNVMWDSQVSVLEELEAKTEAIVAGQAVKTVDASSPVTASEATDTDEDSWPEFKDQKVIMLGDCNAGKSSLLGCLRQEQFQPVYESTIGIEHHKVKLTLRGVTINLQVWDLAGESSFGILSKAFLKNAKGAMIVYDVTSEDSFARVPQWIAKIREAYPECPLFLCGNKIDQGEIMIDAKDAKAVCRQHNICGYCHVSAKDGANVQVAFDRLSAPARGG